MLSCPTCHCTYTTSGENQPRLLALCGHTFCYKCLEDRRKSCESPEMFQCPQCSLPCSENHVPNITIMKYVEAMNEKSEERVRKRRASEIESCAYFLANLCSLVISKVNACSPVSTSIYIDESYEPTSVVVQTSTLLPLLYIP